MINRGCLKCRSMVFTLGVRHFTTTTVFSASKYAPNRKKPSTSTRNNDKNIRQNQIAHCQDLRAAVEKKLLEKKASKTVPPNKMQNRTKISAMKSDKMKKQKQQAASRRKRQRLLADTSLMLLEIEAMSQESSSIEATLERLQLAVDEERKPLVQTNLKKHDATIPATRKSKKVKTSSEHKSEASGTDETVRVVSDGTLSSDNKIGKEELHVDHQLTAKNHMQHETKEIEPVEQPTSLDTATGEAPQGNPEYTPERKLQSATVASAESCKQKNIESSCPLSAETQRAPAEPVEEDRKANTEMVDEEATSLRQQRIEEILNEYQTENEQKAIMKITGEIQMNAKNDAIRNLETSNIPTKKSLASKDATKPSLPVSPVIASFRRSGLTSAGNLAPLPSGMMSGINSSSAGNFFSGRQPDVFSTLGPITS